MQFNPWVGKSPWRREKLPTPVFWRGEVRGVFIVSCNSIIGSIVDTSKLGNKVHRLWKSTELTTSSPLSHACLWLLRKCWREKLIHLRTLSTNPCYLDLWIGSASWFETPGLLVFLFDTELPCIFPIHLIFFFWKKNLIEIQLIYMFSLALHITTMFTLACILTKINVFQDLYIIAKIIIIITFKWFGVCVFYCDIIHIDSIHIYNILAYFLVYS